MKFSYQNIKENLRIYNEARETLPVISQYESGDISFQAMQKLKLETFAQFYNFLTSLKTMNFHTQMAITYKELKPILIEHTKNVRFKTWLKNRSEKDFRKLITEDYEVFDRLLNGRWITKPGWTNRGRKTYGRRSNENCEGLDVAFIPLLNWIISNDIEVPELKQTDTWTTFSGHIKYASRIKWYIEVHLNIDVLPLKEISVTTSLLQSVLDFVDGEQIDFRKLNSDFIIDTFSSKLRVLMSVPQGSLVRSVGDHIVHGRSYLTSGKDYIVESSMVSNGFLRVLVLDDTGFRNWYEYTYFEDKSIDRDLLLNQLGIF